MWFCSYCVLFFSFCVFPVLQMPRVKKFSPKRKFRGNQFETKPNNTHQLLQKSPVETVSTGSASRRKLSHSACNKNMPSSIVSSNNDGNVIVNLNMLSKLLKSAVKCKYCNCEDSIDVSEDISARKGLSSRLLIACNACKMHSDTMTSPVTNSRHYSVNIQLAYAMRCIGRGRRAAQTFCAVMDLPPPPLRFDRYNKLIHNALRDVSEHSMKRAAEEAVALSENTDIVAAFDGSWQKRGHTSLNGVVTATFIETGKILDYECLTKHCQGCSSKFIGTHICVKNFDGPSGNMETKGVLNIFRRSEVSRGVRYVGYLGDGDCKGHSTVVSDRPYGDTVIEKLECVGHVQKRMGARLRKLCKDFSGKKLSDGKHIGGSGRLTKSEIDCLTQYYGLAIRRNVGDLENMRRAVWATWFHRVSTDETPQHGLCPKGEDSWCKYWLSNATGIQYSHKHSLPLAVMEVIKPIYRDLANKNLLRKCMHGLSQNTNESFNSCIWERIPKTVFVGLTVLKIGVMDAIITFNDGAISRINVMKKLNIQTGRNMASALTAIDKRRVTEAEIAAEAATKEGRIKKRMKRKSVEDKETGGELEYAAGMF